MAYLKGGSYVDGDLYVQDALLVGNIRTTTGQDFPHITDTFEFADNTMIKVQGADKALSPSYLVESAKDATDVGQKVYRNVTWKITTPQDKGVDSQGTQVHKMMLTIGNVESRCFRAEKASKIVLDSDTSTWKLVDSDA